MLGMLVLGACGCRPPTEVTVIITTNVACARIQDTAIVVGAPGGSVEKKNAGTVTPTCEAGRIGSIVLVPSKDRKAPFVVKVVTGVGVSSEACIAQPSQPGDVKGERGCIVARRELAFIPQTPLTLPIVMHQSCIGVVCDESQTCVEGGQCVSSKVDPIACGKSGGCGEGALGDTSASSSGMMSSSTGTGGMGGAGGMMSSSTGMGGAGGMMSSSSGTTGSTSSSSSSSSSSGMTGSTSSSSSSSSGTTGPTSSSSSSSSSSGGTTGATGSGGGSGGGGVGGGPSIKDGGAMADADAADGV